MNPVQFKLINGKEKLLHVNKMKKDLSQGDNNLNIMHQDEHKENKNHYDDDKLLAEDDQEQDQSHKKPNT